MQKNLKSKVLLTLLAASVFYLPAYANAAYLTLTTDTDGTQHYYFTPGIMPASWFHTADNAIYYQPTKEGNQLTINGTPDFISQQDDYYHTMYGAYKEVNTEGQGAAANGNTVTLNGTAFANADPEIAGAYVDLLEDGNATLNDNAVNINSGSFADETDIYGAHAVSNSTGNFTLLNNSVTIDGAAFKFDHDEHSKEAYISGAFADAGDGSTFNLTGNKVEIKNAEFRNNTTNDATDATAYIYGAGALPSTNGKKSQIELTGNKVLISGGKFISSALIAGAYTNSTYTNPDYTTATFSKNEVFISGGEFANATYIFGVMNDGAYLTADIQNNTVTITGDAGGKGHDLSKAAFYGFGVDEDLNNNDTFSEAVVNNKLDEYFSDNYGLTENPITAANNNLNIKNWSGTIKSAKLFDNINFVDTEWNPGGTVLTIEGAAKNDLAKTNIDIVSFASGEEFTPGDSMTFIKGNVDLGIAAEQNNAAETAEYINAGVAQVVNGSTTITEGGTAFEFTVDSVGLAQQTYLVAETRAASAAFVNQGTDLINDSLDVLGRDGTYGVKTFAAVQGNRSSYDVADDLKINGWSVIAGFGAENEHKGGDFAWGVSAAITVLTTALITSSSAVTAVWFTTAAALRQGTRTPKAFIRKAACAQVC